MLDGKHGSNSAALFVSEYFERKTLSKLGYKFDVNDLSSLDVEIFTTIESEINSHSNESMKKARGKK